MIGFKHKTMSLCVAGSIVLLSSALMAADLALDPCSDGGVSATGLYASQDLEDAAHEAIAKALDLEPCVNGGVSAFGLYVSQAEADASRDVIVDATAD